MIFKDPRLVLYEWDAPEDTENRMAWRWILLLMIRNQKDRCWKFLSEWTKLLSITQMLLAQTLSWIVLIEVLILRQISDLQAELRTNPMNNKDDSWLKLGHLEFTLEII